MGRVSEVKVFSDYIKNNEFETMKVFGRENISVTQPTLENISVTRPTSITDPLTRPTDFPEENEKGHVPDDPDPDPSLSDSSSKKNERDKKRIVVNTGKMTHQTHH